MTMNIAQHIIEYVRRNAQDLPADAKVEISTPDDGRFWVDVLSEQHAWEADGGLNDGDPIVDQWVLVSINELSELAPDFLEHLSEQRGRR